MGYSHDLQLFFRNKSRQRNLAILAIVLGIIRAIALTLSVPTMTLAAPNMVSVRFEKCANGHRVGCVIDGDTLWIDGTKVRVADIDAPEISEPRWKDWPGPGQAVGNPGARRLGRLRPSRSALNRAVPIRSRY